MILSTCLVSVDSCPRRSIYFCFDLLIHFFFVVVGNVLRSACYVMAYLRVPNTTLGLFALELNIWLPKSNSRLVLLKGTSIDPHVERFCNYVNNNEASQKIDYQFIWDSFSRLKFELCKLLLCNMLINDQLLLFSTAFMSLIFKWIWPKINGKVGKTWTYRLNLWSYLGLTFLFCFHRLSWLYIQLNIQFQDNV